MTAVAVEPARRSEITERADAFVAAHREPAEREGRRLAEFVGDPELLATELDRVLAALADPEYAKGSQRIAPGLGPVYGVRWPLLAAVSRGFRRATRRDRPSSLLYVADRLLRADRLEPQWFAFGVLERVVVDDPERSWQLLRAAARRAGDWITVDSLAHPYGRGILSESYRWAELEQLVYAPNRWERRLVGSTIATIPFIDRRLGRSAVVREHGLALVRELIGDAEPDVQKALAWALRSLALFDREAVSALCHAEADMARATADGHRAWVIRDVLPKLDDDDAAAIRESLAGIRKAPRAASTSAASRTAKAFASLDLGRDLPEPPLT